MSSSNVAYERLPRSSSDLDPSDELKDKPLPKPRRFFFALGRKTRRFCRICRPIYILIAFALFLLWQITFNASYTNPAPFEIPKDETLFIAANIIDASLINGAWGKNVMELVDLVGKDKVYVSIYGGPTSALKSLSEKLECENSLVSEEEYPLDMTKIPKTQLPTGESRVKRIAYLAEVRNKALEPLDKLKRKFDKVLFVNDVHFNANDAARLIWGTNINKEGKSEYKAACGVDFMAWWKFYDTFATRDAGGYSMGVPIFPWFGPRGDAVSRKDVLAGKDAVRVKSCWGGMTAFDARYFQKTSKGIFRKAEEAKEPKLPLRFRSEMEPFWDSSECCLIHADVIALPNFTTSSKSTATKKSDPWDSGIYMNPYVRVSYDAKTQSRMALVRRFERLMAIPQYIISYFAHMPVYNYRRTEVEGQIIQDRLWVPSRNFSENTIAIGGHQKRATIGSAMSEDYWSNKGYYIDSNRTATRGGYCGVRQLLVMKEGKLKDGEGNWDNLVYEVPPRVL